MKPHERWWSDNWETQAGKFHDWLASSQEPSRSLIVQIVDGLHAANQLYDDLTDDEKKPISVLECGVGCYIDYERYWAARQYVEYHGLDVTPQIVELGWSRGITVWEGSIEAIPCPDNAFDVVYCRHVLEHLPSWEDALLEMLKVARDRVIVAFFLLDLDAEADRIYYDTVPEVPATYHNVYSRANISRWLDDRGYAYAWALAGTDWVLEIWSSVYLD